MAKTSPERPLTKREKFERAGRFPFKKVAIGGAAVILIAGAVLGYVLATKAPSVGEAVVSTAGPQITSAPAEAGDIIPMVGLSAPIVSGDTVELSLSEVQEARIGGALYTRTNPMPVGYDDLPGAGLPILAYVSPSSKLVVASSLCEPCHSYTFHIDGNDLVCDACFTRWNLDTLEGVSGGCTAYPPAVITATVQGDKVLIDKAALESWTPRI